MASTVNIVKTRTKEVKTSGGEPTNIAFLNCQLLKLTAKHFCLHL